MSTTPSAEQIDSTINFWQLKALLPLLIEALRYRCYVMVDSGTINGVAQMAAERIAKS